MSFEFAQQKVGATYRFDLQQFIASSGSLAVTNNDDSIIELVTDAGTPVEIQLPTIVIAATGFVGHLTGTLAKTNANDTLTAVAKTTVKGTLARTNSADTCVAFGLISHAVGGTLDRTNANDTGVISGSVGRPTGTLAKTNADDALSSSGVGNQNSNILTVTTDSDSSNIITVTTSGDRQGERWGSVSFESPLARRIRKCLKDEEKLSADEINEIILDKIEAVQDEQSNKIKPLSEGAEFARICKLAEQEIRRKVKEQEDEELQEEKEIAAIFLH